MDFRDRLSGLFRANLPQLNKQALQIALDRGRKAKLAEDYDEALGALDEALTQARAAQDPAALTIVTLHHAEVLIQQARWDEARAVLSEIRERPQSDIQLAYAHNGLGAVAQAQGQWPEARSEYERALKYARSGGAAGAEGRALGQLAGTYLQEGNASYAIHLLRDALPKLNVAGDVEMSSAFVGMLGQAMIQSGQDVEGQHLLERALRLAEQIDYRLYERHWSLVLAGRAASEGRYTDARAHYGRAVRLFDRVPPSAAQVEALTQTSKMCLSLHDHEEALHYARTAVEVSQQVGDAKLTVMAQGTLGVVLRALGQSAEAIPYLEAAAQAQEGRAQIDVLRSLAEAHVDNDAFDTAISIYERAIMLAETQEAALEQAQAQRDLGLAYLKAGRLAEAITAWSAALAIYEQKKAYAQMTRLHCDIGNARKVLGQGARAMRDYEQALMVLNSVDEADLETRGLVLSNAANAYAEQGDIESADAFFNEAIQLADRLEDRVAEATRNGNYAWFLLMVGRPRRAIATLERALRLSRELKLPLHQAIQTDNLGLAHDSLGEYETALGYHQQALDLILPLNRPHWEMAVRINLGNTLIALAQPAAAVPLFTAALDHGRARDEAELVVRALSGLARAEVAAGRPDAASGPLEEAINLARKVDMRRWLAEALSVRSQQQAALGDHAGASTIWAEAQHLYTILHMPQAKRPPAWLEQQTNEG
ncbi:MAG: tetratricopeptide repeat protein [Chloroflexi bacterium]|nr:tetratricopeptide repeat protein [Chloroflexota bacterium]